MDPTSSATASTDGRTYRRRIVYLSVFTACLLCFGLTLKSGVIIDRSFLPRVLFLVLLMTGFFLTRLRKPFELKNTLFEWGFILFILWNLLSSLWATCVPEALMQSELVFLSFAVYVMISACAKEDARFENIFTRILMVVLLYSFALSFFTISQMTFYNPYNIVSISANNNLYSGFLLLCLPFTLNGFARNGGFWKYLSLLVALLSVFFIIIIQSRAVYLGLFTATVLSGIFIFMKFPRILKRKNMITGLLAFLLLASGVGIFYSLLDSTRKNYFLSKIPVWEYFRSYDDVKAEKAARYKNSEGTLEKIASFDYSEDYYENANLRLIFWKKSAGLMLSHPVAGVGSGNWKISIPSVAEPPNPDHTLKNYTYSYPHNEWIGIMTELGIIGFILSLFIFFIPLGFVFRRLWKTGSVSSVTVLFYASFIAGFYVFASFDFPLKRVEHNVILFSAFAFLLTKVALPKVVFHRRDAETQRRIGPIAISLRLSASAVHKKLTTILFLILLGFSAFVSIERIKGEYYTLRMFKDERVNDRNVIRYSREAGNMFYRITPNTLPLDWFEGVAWSRLGDVNQALACYKRALQYTPYEVRVLNDYAVALYQAKQTGEAKSVLFHALRLDPWFDDLRFNLGAIYYWSNRRDSALFYISRCRESQKKEDYLKELR